MAFLKDDICKKIFNRNDGAKFFFMMDYMFIIEKDDSMEQYDLRLLRKDIEGNLYFKDTNKDLMSILNDVHPTLKPATFTCNHQKMLVGRFMGYLQSNLMGI